MALIKCPECGKDVSDTAKSCIHCGYVLKEDIVAQPQTFVIAPENQKSAKKSLNKGVTINLIVAIVYLLFFAAYAFVGEGIYIDGIDRSGIIGPIGLCIGIIPIAMSIVIFAVPKLRNKLFLILYILACIVSSPLIVFTTIFMGPAALALLIGIVLVIKSMLMKD